MRTWHDSVMQLTQMVGASLTDGRSLHLAKLAMQDAQAQLMSERDWKYMDRSYSFLTSASQSSSTITYDHTGGSSERLVTLASGTWPSWAAYGILLVDQKMYRVAQRLDDTTLMLSEEANPGADLAALTEYVMYREAYTLPFDVNQFYGLNRVNDYDPAYVSPPEFEAAKESQEYYGQARIYTVMRDPKNVERQAVWFYPGPDTQENFQAIVQRRPSLLKTFDYQTGTVSITAGAVAVTSSGATFDSNMVGAVIRFGDASSVPESLENHENTFAHEAEIIEVPTSSTLTVALGASQTSSAVKFRISSRVEVDDGSLWSALMACARWKYRSMSQAPTWQVDAGFKDYRVALQAAANDDGMKARQSRFRALGPVGAALVYPRVEW